MRKSEQPAFPQQAILESKGLTKREYFAAMAMQGFIASPSSLNHSKDKSVQDIAKMSLIMADELLKQLEP